MYYSNKSGWLSVLRQKLDSTLPALAMPVSLGNSMLKQQVWRWLCVCVNAGLEVEFYKDT